MDEDALDAAAATEEAGFLSALEAREKAVDGHLRAGRAADAVRAALESPPFPSKVASTKERSAAAALRAIVALGAREADATALVEALDSDAADVLMKYVYRGLSKPDNSGLLLKLHAQLVEKRGLGCIVRAIVDRKTA